jgi:hypothetical protein
MNVGGIGAREPVREPPANFRLVGAGESTAQVLAHERNSEVSHFEGERESPCRGAIRFPLHVFDHIDFASRVLRPEILPWHARAR